jgi:hypothetical protein
MAISMGKMNEHDAEASNLGVLYSQRSPYNLLSFQWQLAISVAKGNFSLIFNCKIWDFQSMLLHHVIMSLA